MSEHHRIYRILAMFAAVLTITHLVSGTAAAAIFSFTAVLNSGQEIQTPKPESDSQGVALMTLDTKTRLLCYAISYDEGALSSSETAAHFHGPASAGENASIVHPISPDVSAVGSPKSGCVGPLSAKEVGQLKKGLFYINIHSTNFTSGELRGQVFRMIGAKTNGNVAEPD